MVKVLPWIVQQLPILAKNTLGQPTKSNGSDSGVDEENESDCSLFNVFYDIPTPSDSEPTLLTIISGLALEPYHTMTDDEVIKGALNALKAGFSASQDGLLSGVIYVT